MEKCLNLSFLHPCGTCYYDYFGKKVSNDKITLNNKKIIKIKLA